MAPGFAGKAGAGTAGSGGCGGGAFFSLRPSALSMQRAAMSGAMNLQADGTVVAPAVRPNDLVGVHWNKQLYAIEKGSCCEDGDLGADHD